MLSDEQLDRFFSGLDQWKAACAERDALIAELERLCDATYVATGADAYNNACDEMERWQKQRKADGKEVGTTGSLCDGIAWLYLHVSKLEQQLQAYEQHGVTCQTFRHFVSEPCAECNSPGRCAKQLEQQLAEARKDADRYQWLCGFSSVSMPELTWGRRAGIPKNKLDAAIDKAIKEQT